MTKIVPKVRRSLVDAPGAIISNIRTFDPQANLIVFSDARGGSTWITEAISRLHKTVMLWEPLYLYEGNPFGKLGFAWYQYIPEEATWGVAKRMFERLFSGKILNSWVCQQSSLVKFLYADRMVVKFCRANALIPWLTRVFKFRYDPIYLVRHPFAVVASQLKHGAWNQLPERYSIPSCPYNEIYTQHSDFLLSLTTKEEALVATWCLINNVSLHNDRNNRNWITVYYEDLLINPEKELQRIFARWKLPISQYVINQLGIPSSTAKEPTFQVSTEKQLSKWTSFFNQEQKTRMAAVLQYFQIEHYTASDIFPCLQQSECSDISTLFSQKGY